MRAAICAACGRPWLPILAFALVEIAGPWLLLGVAEQQLSSSLTGLLLASVPLVAALLAWLGAGRWSPADDRPMCVA